MKGTGMAFTFFFRDLQVLELAVQHTLPELSGRSRARIWDAGCAMGPEVYTLAILLAGRMGSFGFRNLRIDATDLDETGQFGEIVQAGVYSQEELLRMPEGVLEQYFEPAPEAGRYRVVDSVRSRVHFRRHDLLTLREVDSGYSLVVCKNVLLHFSEEQRTAVIRMFHRALAPGGLFVTEHTQKLPADCEALFARVEDYAPLYRKREAA